MLLSRLRSAPEDPGAGSQEDLQRRLEAIFAQAPELRPAPALFDYPLTYPPAIAVQGPAHAGAPTDIERQELGIGALPAAGYYFHFGFCQYKCRYCFHYEIKINRTDELKARYVEALLTEMRRFRDLAPRLQTGLYFLGGGTPTALSLPQLERFLDGLLQTFGPVPTAMSTVEAKPVTATVDKLRALRAAGFSRINLGVQSLDPALYAQHHHGEPLSVALDAITRARALGFSFINIDLMTGLAGQTPASWQRTLSEIERLVEAGAIDSLFIYPYHDDPRSRTFGEAGAVPPFIETAYSDAQARSLMERLGWSELGARFYRSPRHVRHELRELARVRVNPAYGEVLYQGFGNSAFSLGDRAMWLNRRDIGDYCAAIEAGASPIGHWAPMNDAQRATRDLVFDLLYSPITRLRGRVRKYGADAHDHHAPLLQRWVDLGLGRLHRLSGTFSLTPFGKLLHLQMIPRHYLPADRGAFDAVMEAHRLAGPDWRGY